MMLKKYLDKPLIPINKSTYLSLLLFFTPLLNFLSGINIDIYSPSMPSIAHYFDTSIMVVKNTITITLLGWTIGALVFGVLMDSLGRKCTLAIGISIYCIASILAITAHTIDILMMVRFVQGFMIASISIGCKSLIIDNLTGKKFHIGMQYTSMGYALGPIIGPVFGGLLQFKFGWQANFIALTIFSAIILFILILFLQESIPQRHPLHLKSVASRSLTIISNKQFLAGLMLAGLIQIQLLLYPTLGPFIVENILHHSVLVYGNTALVIGASYLVGTFMSRFLLRHTSPKSVCYYGYAFLLAALSVSYYFAITQTLDLLTLMLPIMLLCIGAGLRFSNIMGSSLKQFPGHVGIATAINISLHMLIASAGIYIISHIHIDKLYHLVGIYLVLVLLEILFFCYYCSVFNNQAQES
jgi:DHA1 family bicyclomycin/chloramphenicol resistance-like MFS transporter